MSLSLFVSARHHGACAALKFLMLLVLGTAIPVAAQTSTTFKEQYKLIKAPNAIASIGEDLFGDHVNLYNGALEFTQTDVSLRGNNALPVAVGRRITAGRYLFDKRAFGRWDIEFRTCMEFLRSVMSVIARDGTVTARPPGYCS